ncbi:MAG TPA: RloB family protein [Micromonosporaceae bacterium]|nr:RloB family protein [Micromonosporaceae bacterium]
MARREHRQTRQSFLRPRRPTILVYCLCREQKKDGRFVGTEAAYFDALRLDRHRELPVVLDVRAKAVAPCDLVVHAAEFARKSPDDYEEVWCVVDVDRFPMTEVGPEARRHGVRLAVSSPCFELWLLLHHAGRRAPAASCDELGDQIRRHVPRYSKSQLRFADFSAGIRDALERARLLSKPDDDTYPNPSSGVWQLMEKILTPPEGL